MNSVVNKTILGLPVPRGDHDNYDHHRHHHDRVDLLLGLDVLTRLEARVDLHRWCLDVRVATEQEQKKHANVYRDDGAEQPQEWIEVTIPFVDSGTSNDRFHAEDTNHHEHDDGLDDNDGYVTAFWRRRRRIEGPKDPTITWDLPTSSLPPESTTYANRTELPESWESTPLMPKFDTEKDDDDDDDLSDDTYTSDDEQLDMSGI